jgi:glycerophosphoryl diester phosphodiesterase
MNIGKFCAHRGVPYLFPENTIQSFEAAVQLQAEEMEFDIRMSENGKLYVSHNRLQEDRLDSYCTPEEVFERFANKIDFNIHIKRNGDNEKTVKELARLIEKYDAYEHAFFAGSYYELPAMVQFAPDIRRMAIQWIEDEEPILEKAKRFQCFGAQLWLGMFDAEIIRGLHDEGIRCNICDANDEEHFDLFFQMGADVILTNRMDLVAEYRKKRGEFFK